MDRAEAAKYLTELRGGLNDYVLEQESMIGPTRDVMLSEYIALLWTILRAEGDLPVTVGDIDDPSVPVKMASTYIVDQKFSGAYTFSPTFTGKKILQLL